MKLVSILLIFLVSVIYAEELKIKADYFESSENNMVSVFRGHVHVTKGFDEIKANKLTIYTDKKRNPTKFEAEGNVKFKIKDESGKRYKGKAQRVIYIPSKKIYKFYTDVFLEEIGDKREIEGDVVEFNAITGKAHAKGVEGNPVIMTFDIKDEKEK